MRRCRPASSAFCKGSRVCATPVGRGESVRACVRHTDCSLVPCVSPPTGEMHMAYENRGRFEAERHEQNKAERERGRTRGRSQPSFERGPRDEAGNEPRFVRPFGDEDFSSEEEYWREPANLPDWGGREW